MNERFASRVGWWGERNPDQLSEAPTVASGYVRHRIPAGGAGGSFHYEDNDGYIDFQVVVGDFDVVADVQCLNFAEADLPPDNGLAHAYGIACHNFCQPENFGAFGSRDYYHRVITNAPSGGASTARMTTEWKYTVASVTTWDTVDGLVLGDAAALGANFDSQGGRWWVRIRRVADVFTSWDAPIRTDGAVPTGAEWVNEHSQSVPALRELVLVGLVGYSADSGGSVTGRCRAFLNYNVQG